MRILFLLSLIISTVVLGQSDKAKSYFEAKSRWLKTHPLTPANSPPERRRIFDQQLAEWVHQWPNEPETWMTRIKSLATIDATTDRELEHLGETVLKVASEHPSTAVHFVPLQTEIAQVWDRKASTAGAVPPTDGRWRSGCGTHGGGKSISGAAV
jgi:hypothetical protein